MDRPGASTHTRPTVAAFAGAFGFAAAIASELLGARTAGVVAAAGAIGLTAAAPVAVLAVRLSRWAQNIPTDGTPGRADLVGAIGVVVTPISEHIRANLHGVAIVKVGGTEDAVRLPAGAGPSGLREDDHRT